MRIPSPCTHFQQYNCKLISITAWRSHPAKHGETFDGPPTLERSGSEHRRAVTSFLLRFLSPTRGTEGVVKTIEKAWLEVELSLQERRRGRKKPFLMGKSDANECNESSLSNCRVQLALSTKKDGMILETCFDQ